MHERISINHLCFPGASLQQLVGYWRELEPRCVSLVSPPLLQADTAPLHEALAGGAFRLETIAHMFSSGRSLTPHEEDWQAGRAELSRLIRIAEQLGARSIYMLTGGHGSLGWEQAAEAFAAAVAPCVTEARRAGVALLIENALPLYADVHIAHSLRDTLDLAELAGIGVCMDLFGCWTEAGLRASIGRGVPLCQIIQVSDYVYGDRSLPSRAVPGDGAMPLRRMLDWILGAGYTGAFDLELIGPRIEQEGHFKAAGRAAERLGEMLHALGA